MPITVPEPTSAAAIASLTAALSGAGTTDATVGASLLVSLTAAADTYNADATEYNADLAAYPAIESAAVADANDVCDRVQTIAPFTEPTPVANARTNAINRCRAAQSVKTGTASISSAIASALTSLTSLVTPTEPSTTALFALVEEAEEFVEYLSA